MTNFLLYGWLWKDQQLDCLIVATHAPGQSAYNCIEHVWSLLSRSLTGVTLQNHLPGQCLPIEQRLGAKERKAKEAKVFDNAIGILSGYWNGKSFDGHPIKSVAVKCIDSSQQYTDHKVLEDFSKFSYRAVTWDPTLKEMQQFLQFLCRHAVKSSYLCLFLRSEIDSCQHRSRTAVTAPGVTSLLRAAGDCLFTPTPSPHLPGHFLTFLECCPL